MWPSYLLCICVFPVFFIFPEKYPGIISVRFLSFFFVSNIMCAREAAILIENFSLTDRVKYVPPVGLHVDVRWLPLKQFFVLITFWLPVRLPYRYSYIQTHHVDNNGWMTWNLVLCWSIQWFARTSVRSFFSMFCALPFFSVYSFTLSPTNNSHFCAISPK